jgi:Flp pilus assembly protein TadB
MLTLVIVTAIFYMPFHVGPPLLLALLYGRDAAEKKSYAREILVESLATMIVALVVFFLLWETRLWTAISVMLIMMGLPYIRVWKFRNKVKGER